MQGVYVAVHPERQLLIGVNTTGTTTSKTSGNIDYSASFWSRFWAYFTAKRIEKISAGLSLLLLIFAILALIAQARGFEIGDRTIDGDIFIWRQTLQWSKLTPNSTLPALDGKVEALKIAVNDFSAYGYIQQYEGLQSKVNSLWLLFFVFLFSVGFQGFRAASDSWTGDEPDATRWVEYAFTSPLQVFIVAGQRFIGDEGTFLGLFAAQLALVLIGYAVELELERQQTRNVAKNTKQPIRYTSAPYFVVLAFLVHGLIWYVIGAPLYKQKELFDKIDWNATGDNAPPWTAIEVTYFLQLFFFTTFGLVQAWQVFEFSRTQTSSINERFWLKYTKAYGILSVSAKMALEISFLVAAIAMPPVSLVTFDK